jgi:hypothetical protein
MVMSSMHGWMHVLSLAHADQKQALRVGNHQVRIRSHVNTQARLSSALTAALSAGLAHVLMTVGNYQQVLRLLHVMCMCTHAPGGTQRQMMTQVLLETSAECLLLCAAWLLIMSCHPWLRVIAYHGGGQ